MLALSSLTGLEVLHLSGTAITNAALAVLPSLRVLRQLFLARCKVSDAGAPLQPAWPLTRGVRAVNPPVRAGLVGLRRSWALQELNVSYTGVTAAGVRRLVLPLVQHSLQHVRVSGCHVDTGIRDEAPLAIVSGTMPRHGGYA